MRRAGLGIALAAVLVPPPAASAAETAVTFTRDVAPIFYKNCVECHRPTMFAPMSLIKYEDARPWAKSIKQRVVSRAMPPWGADRAHGTFKNDPSLSEKDIATVAAWVDAGAPRGDDRDLPAAPKFVDGWTIGKPDAVFEMTEDFKIPANGAVPYQYIRVPTHLTEDKWITAIEIVPGSRAHVHHVIAYTQPASEEKTSTSPLGGTNIGGTTPNKPGVVFGDGVARLLRKGHDIVLQMHYTTNGTEGTDRTRVAVIYAKEPPKKLAAGGLVVNPRFVIPAGDAAYEVKGMATLQRDTVLTNLTPHMHVRGKRWSYVLTLPDGTSTPILSVPKYDFNWQLTYELATPKVLPKGTKLEVIAHFDNSTGNKFNPDPAKDVRWGDQTWEEMMIGFYGSVVDPAVAATYSQPERE